MKSNRRIIVAISVLAFVSITLMSLRPVPSPNEKNTLYIKGVVTKIAEGKGEADIIIEIGGNEEVYYINRGLEKGLSIEKLKDQILHKNIELIYIKHWSLLIGTAPRHIAEISWNQEIIYSEFSH